MYDDCCCYLGLCFTAGACGSGLRLGIIFWTLLCACDHLWVTMIQNLWCLPFHLGMIDKQLFYTYNIYCDINTEILVTGADFTVRWQRVCVCGRVSQLSMCVSMTGMT